MSGRGLRQGDSNSVDGDFEAAPSQRSTSRSCLSFTLSTLRSRFLLLIKSIFLTFSPLSRNA
jgi:hypothetical protein